MVKNLVKKQITYKNGKDSTKSSKKQSLKSKRLRRRVKQLSLPTLKTNTVFSNGAALAANPNLALKTKSMLPVAASKNPIQKASKKVLPTLKSLQTTISNGHHLTNSAPLIAVASTNNDQKTPLIVKPFQLNNNSTNKSVVNNNITSSVFKPAVVVKSYENKRIISTNKESVHRNILANGLLKLNLHNTQNIGKQTNTSTNYAKTILFSNVARKYNQTGSHKPILSTFSQTSTAMTSQTVEIIDLTADSDDDDDGITTNNFNLNLIRFAKVLKS